MCGVRRRCMWEGGNVCQTISRGWVGKQLYVLYWFARLELIIFLSICLPNFLIRRSSRTKSTSTGRGCLWSVWLLEDNKQQLSRFVNQRPTLITSQNSAGTFFLLFLCCDSAVMSLKFYSYLQRPLEKWSLKVFVARDHYADCIVEQFNGTCINYPNTSCLFSEQLNKIFS